MNGVWISFIQGGIPGLKSGELTVQTEPALGSGAAFAYEDKPSANFYSCILYVPAQSRSGENGYFSITRQDTTKTQVCSGALSLLQLSAVQN